MSHNKIVSPLNIHKKNFNMLKNIMNLIMINKMLMFLSFIFVNSSRSFGKVNMELFLLSLLMVDWILISTGFWTVSLFISKR